jgi:drug/metabolite transporter (DMT)-like permease
LGLLLATTFTGFFQSIVDSTVAIGMIMYSTFPLFVAFLEPVFLQERLTAKDILIAGITLLGIMLIVPTFTLSSTITQGVLWGVTSGFAYGSLIVLNKKFVKRYSSVQVAFYQDVAASFILLPVVFFQQVTFSYREMFLLLVLGIVFTALAHSLFIKGMTHFRAHTASIIGMLEPVYGAVLAVFLLHEIPSFKELLGGGIILGAAVYITYSHAHSNAGSMNQLQVEVPIAGELQVSRDENARVIATTQSLCLHSSLVSLEKGRASGLRKVILRPYEHKDGAQRTSNPDSQKVQK